MKILFHRSASIEVKVQKPDSVRAFVFDLQLGFSKDEPQVDPMSGMLINLVKVDEILQQLSELWASKNWPTLTELLEKSKDFAESKAENEGVFLEEVRLYEKRGFWITWKQDQLFMGDEVFRELEGHLYRLRFESALLEAKLEQQHLEFENFEELTSERIFTKNPGLSNLSTENLVTSEKWFLQNAR